MAETKLYFTTQETVQAKLFCKITEEVYDNITDALDLALVLPMKTLSIIKSTIRTLEYITLATYESSLDTIENLIYEYLEVSSFDTSKQNNNFCTLLYSCQALRNSLFDPDDTSGDSDASFVKMLSLDIRNKIRGGSYDIFEEQVCKLSMARILEGFGATLLTKYAGMLTDLQDKIESAINLDNITDAYTELLETNFLNTGKNVFDLLDSLDNFTQCAFGACDFIYSSQNKKESTAETAHIIKETDNWVVDLSDLTVSMDATSTKLLDKISILLAFTQNTETINSSGISSDEVLKS